MFIYSVRGSSVKFFAVLLASCIVLALLIAFVPGARTAAAEEAFNFTDVRSNDDRIDFLSQFGWEVTPTAKEEADVTIPSEFDKVFVNYNEIQKRQGLDLSKYRRKDVKRYTYTVTNFEGYDGEVYANILIYRNNVIAGDICSADPKGFVCGLDGKR